jgi:diguanylate cyclase (GGDEF)-like protein/PAS domain S-box-containing protein
MAVRLLRVLLVEDNPLEAELVRELLGRSRRESFEVEHVDRLSAAIVRLDQGGIDTVLLDFSLPDSQGLATYRGIHAAAPRVPVVILTNLDDEDVAGSAVREGAQDYLIKRELDTAVLVRAIRYAVERTHAEEALLESEQRYALAVQGANDGLWDWNIATGETFFSPRWAAILGLRADGVGATVEEWFSRVHPDDVSELKEALAAHFDGKEEQFEHEHRLRCADLEYRWVLARGVAVRGADGAPARMAGSLTDITVRKRAEERLLHDAFHDALTGLPNRTLFLDRLGLALEQSRRHKGIAFAVLFLDLDRFKNLNDSLGHSAGDSLLVEFATRLKACVRPGDTVARLGGDEFGVLLSDVAAPEDATRVAERILELLEQPFEIGPHEVVITASIGIALGSAEYDRPEDILRDTDTAMYRAKSAGRACFQVFDQAMHSSVAALLKLEMDLRRAVERSSFVMHYQPIIALDVGRIVGFEGLVRWVDPERGVVPPLRFISVAEETGLIVPIGWWALREACSQVRQWQERWPSDPPLYASVNVSGKIFGQPDIVERVWRVLEETGLPATSLRLEITEGILMDHGEAALKVLAELRALGVQFSIDDFGTGFSSLSYLQRFSYDTLKIDRSFIAGMQEKPDVNAIVQTIVGLGNRLGMSVVAEGVETVGQFERLKAMNCPAAQGFWFSEPLEPLGAERLLHEKLAWTQ